MDFQNLKVFFLLHIFITCFVVSSLKYSIVDSYFVDTKKGNRDLDKYDDVHS